MSSQRVVFLNVPKLQPIDIEFQDIRYEVKINRKETKTILNGISGTFKSGELSAIMGPSGAGKSTLLNILSGLVHDRGVSGSLMKNEIKKMSKKTSTYFKSNASYIQQDDDLYKYFTVFEYMTFSCHVKIGNTLSNKSKKMLIFEILEGLGLSENVDTRCSKLSGGQRKRISIALELIDNPPILYMDEPTSGLDSISAINLIHLLQSLARGGRNIICTTHQPSSSIFSLFDFIYTIANGECIYQGSSSNVVTFLSSIGLVCPKYHNPADFLLEVANGEYGEYQKVLTSKSRTSSDQWRHRNTSSEMQIEKSMIEPVEDTTSKLKENEIIASVLVNSPNNLYRLSILLTRIRQITIRDWSLFYVRLGAYPVISIILGLLYQNFGYDGKRSLNNISYLLVQSIFILFNTMIPNTVMVPSQIRIIKKEIFNNWYSVESYFLAYSLIMIPFQFILIFLFTTISYLITHQPFEIGRYVLILLLNMLNCLISDTLGIIFGSLFTPVNALFVGAVYYTIHLLFSGLLIFINHLNLIMWLVSFLFYTRFLFESQMLVIYDYGRNVLHCSEVYCHYADPRVLMRDIGIKERQTDLPANILILFIFLFVYKFIAYKCLKLAVKKK